MTSYSFSLNVAVRTYTQSYTKGGACCPSDTPVLHLEVEPGTLGELHLLSDKPTESIEEQKS